jgi:hypothetical protein
LDKLLTVEVDHQLVVVPAGFVQYVAGVAVEVDQYVGTEADDVDRDELDPIEAELELREIWDEDTDTDGDTAGMDVEELEVFDVDIEIINGVDAVTRLHVVDQLDDCAVDVGRTGVDAVTKLVEDRLDDLEVLADELGAGGFGLIGIGNCVEMVLDLGAGGGLMVVDPVPAGKENGFHGVVVELLVEAGWTLIDVDDLVELVLAGDTQDIQGALVVEESLVELLVGKAQEVHVLVELNCVELLPAADAQDIQGVPVAVDVGLAELLAAGDGQESQGVDAEVDEAWGNELPKPVQLQGFQAADEADEAEAIEVLEDPKAQEFHAVVLEVTVERGLAIGQENKPVDELWLTDELGTDHAQGFQVTEEVLVTLSFGIVTATDEAVVGTTFGNVDGRIDVGLIGGGPDGVIGDMVNGFSGLKDVDKMGGGAGTDEDDNFGGAIELEALEERDDPVDHDAHPGNCQVPVELLEVLETELPALELDDPLAVVLLVEDNVERSVIPGKVHVPVVVVET